MAWIIGCFNFEDDIVKVTPNAPGTWGAFNSLLSSSCDKTNVGLVPLLIRSPDRIWYAVYGFHESTWHNNSCYGKWVNNGRDFRYAAVRPGNEVMGRTRRHQKSLSLLAWRTAYCMLGLICIGEVHRRFQWTEIVCLGVNSCSYFVIFKFPSQ